MRKTAILLLICWVLPAHGQTLTPISLEEATAKAFENNPTLREAEWEVKSSRWGMVRAVSDALPKVTFTSSLTRTDDETVGRQNIMRDVILQEYGQYIDPDEFPPFAYKDMYSSHISIDQPIYNGGVEITALRIAGKRKRVINLTLETQKRTLILNVQTAYFTLCRAYRAYQLQERSLAVTKGYLERFGRQKELGMISEVDLLRWEAQESSDQAALIEARNNLKLAELSLEQVMGEFQNQSYYPVDLTQYQADDYDYSSSLPQLEELWEEMQNSSPDLEIMDKSVKLEKENVWIASSNFQPKLNFNYTYSWEADNDWELDGFKTWTAGINLSMPLFSSFGNVARFQEAKINVKKAQEQAIDYETGLYIRLTASYNGLRAAGERLKAGRTMLRQSEEVLSRQGKQYELGMITTLELLDARTVTERAELASINALFDALIARAQLERLAGSF
ncbi:TolC family protein [bacterium]|nr:TolC family protein [bacterium]